MKLKEKTCSNGKCGNTFKVWDLKEKDRYYCSEFCFNQVTEGRTFWGAEDRRVTALKRAKEAAEKANK